MAEGNGQKGGKDAAAMAEMSLRRPQNIEAERDVLGAMLLDNYCIPDVAELVRADDFYSGSHRLIFQAILDIYNHANMVDLTMLADKLRKWEKIDEVGGLIGLAELESNVMGTGSAPELARIVADKSVLRKLMTAAEDILKDCAEEKRDVDEQINVAEKRIFDIGQQTSTQSFVPIKDLMGPAIEEIGQLVENKGAVPGLPTGYNDLDNYLNGLHKSDLIILAARPSIGKTAFALNIALNAVVEQNVPVGIFSLEMGAEQLNMRLLCLKARISSSKVRRGMIKDTEFSKLRQIATEMQDAPLFIDDTPGLSLMQLRSRARRLASQYQNLGLIIVDYLQLMSADSIRGREQNRQQEVSEISRGLKALARELRVPLMALSQLSRNIEQRSGKEKGARPILADLRESGAIEQDADVVMFVHRERKEVQKSEDGKPADRTLPIETEIIVGKHRNGPIGTASLLFWPDFTEFTSLSK